MISSTFTPLNVVLVVSDLEYGGTQRQVVALANALNGIAGISAQVCSLSTYNPLVAGLQEAAERLHVIRKLHRYDLTAAGRLARVIKACRAAVVHCFLFDAEVLGRVAARFLRVPVIIGSERCSVGRMPWKKRFGLRLTDGCAHAIIANSRAGKERYVRDVGTHPDRVHVVYNGVDTDRFAPREANEVRAELGVSRHERLVGMFASFKAHKNFEMYVRTAAWVLARYPRAVFVAVGAPLMQGFDGSAERHQAIRNLVTGLGIDDRFRFVGNRDDVERYYNACDLTVLTSHYEGTPNVLLESMACGVPVVATDVSDNGLIVEEGETGYLVGDDDDKAAGRQVLTLLQNDVLRRGMGAAARQQMETQYSLAALANHTIQVYESVASMRGTHSSAQALERLSGHCDRHSPAHDTNQAKTIEELFP